MKWFFFEFSPQWPYLSSAIKFLILGTFGEWLGGVIRTKGRLMPFPAWMFLPKLLIWAVLGMMVKWAFSSFVALVEVQQAKGLLPTVVTHDHPFLFAFAVSFEMNLFFAPVLMLSHRLFDNVVERKWNFTGIQIALVSIAWFWLPAHTITFLLPEVFRIFFAAVLGICLGVILGFAKREKA